MFGEELVHLWIIVFAAFLIIASMIAMLKVLSPHMPVGLATLMGGI